MQVSDIVHHAPLWKSDHSVITFKFHCYLDYTKPKDRYSYEKADYQGMRNYLTLTNWADNFLTSECSNSVEDIWLSFKSKIYELRNRCVPNTTVTGKPLWNKKGCIPVGKPLQEAIHQKHARHRRWMSAKKKTNDKTACLEYTKARNKVKRMVQQAKKSYEKEICLKSKSSPKAFWSHVQQKLKTKSGVGPLLENNNDITSTKFDD